MVYERVLITAEQLAATVDRLAAEINDRYAGRPLTALILLEGARCFADDLLLKLAMPVERAFLKLSSYAGTAAGTVIINPDTRLQQSLKGKNVLVIDDIYDTGRTLSHLLEWLDICSPRSVKTCVLLEKDIPHDESVTIDFLGMQVPDVFVIGYGMDYDGRYRELPFIAELSP